MLGKHIWFRVVRGVWESGARFATRHWQDTPTDCRGRKLKPAQYCPRLIEIALPIREISAESVRDKRIDQGNISSLHTWWARRPLAASRAVVFASLVPDPDDASCSEDFRLAVERLLKTHIPAELRYYRIGSDVVRDEDPYLPYGSMQDSLRHRLVMFIARWSREYLQFETGVSSKPPKAPQVLDDRCLVKWETSAPTNSQGVSVLKIARELLRVAYNGKPPVVFDPFSGGGAIPLEAGRLGCLALANDYNPVAHLLLHATCDFPKRFGKRGKRVITRYEFEQEVKGELEVKNTLVHDLKYWASQIVERTREKIEHLYPTGLDSRPVMTYLWARTVPCSNPSCRADIPLIRSLVLRTANPKVALTLHVDKARRSLTFGIAKDKAIKEVDGTKAQRGAAKCPYCREPTSEDDLRLAATAGKMGERMIAVVIENDGRREYRPVEEIDIKGWQAALNVQVDMPSEFIVPEINGPQASSRSGSHRSINLELYGITRWGQLFNHRQIAVMSAFVDEFKVVQKMMEVKIIDDEYRRALSLYIALWINRIAARGNSFCRWFPGREAIQSPFSGQSIPMMWDYPEVNPFSNSPAGAVRQLERMIEVLCREQAISDTIKPGITLGSASDVIVGKDSCDCVVTDPPYGDSIAYADLSDFFYVWMKRTLGNVFPDVLSTPQTPKDHEITSHRHRHDGSREVAHAYYRRLLTESFLQARRAARKPELISVMFAHQSADAWTALLTSLFDAGLCPDATWPIATEMPNAALGLGTASLESSVTVVCRPRVVGAAESYRNVRKEVQQVVAEAVHRFWGYGFRGADLIVASYGPAVGVFGKYERVERADGTPVEIPELLDMARQSARDAIAGEFRGDNISTLYYVWANLYGVAEQAWDDARLVAQVGGEAEDAMEMARSHGIFVVDGAHCRLALLADREAKRGLGVDASSPLIDALHRAMLLWKRERRGELVRYLAERDLLEDGPIWKLAQALFEVLPHDGEDWKLVNALVSERPGLSKEARVANQVAGDRQLF